MSKPADDAAAVAAGARGEHTPPTGKRGALFRVVLPLAVAAVIALVPAPAGLAPNAWRYFALFVGVIIALITEPLPSAAVAVIGVTLAAVSGLVVQAPAEAIRWALSGFANSTVWLIFGAFVFAMGYEQTGLGRRIALLLVRWLGGRTLGLGYAIAFADLVLAPFTPSNTARSAGTVYPVIRNIPELYGSRPGPTARRIGAYLMWVAFASTCVTSSMFVTALAPNLLGLEFIKKTTGLEITWGHWLVAFLPIGVPLMLALPWIIYRLYPPEVRASTEVPAWAAAELTRLGAVSRREWTMAALVIIALGFWIFGARYVDATTVALAAISLMLLARVVSWDEILGNKPAWNVLTWFATLVALADGLNRVGFVGWFGRQAAAWLGGFPPNVVMVMLVVLFFVIHYLFASLTARTTAVLPVILAAGVAVPGMPVRTFALLLVFSLGMSGVITPYATGPAPLYYACGFITRREFWRLGFIFGLLFLASLVVLGCVLL